MTIRVLIADDQAMIRSGLRLILEDEPDIIVVGEAADGVEAIRLARQLRPDVCLVDICMPGRDGLEVTRALAGPGVCDPLRVVIVTTFDLDEYVYGALQAGAVGFLLKDAGPALLVEAVRAAHGGDALVSPQVTLRLLQHLGPIREPAAAPSLASLSKREIDVVRTVAKGRRRRRDCRRAVHLPQHSEEPSRQHSEQARCAQPRRDCRLGLGKPAHAADDRLMLQLPRTGSNQQRSPGSRPHSKVAPFS